MNSLDFKIGSNILRNTKTTYSTGRELNVRLTFVNLLNVELGKCL